MDVLTIDFETFYSGTFSLSKITTEEYIRSPLFETIGVSVKVNDAPAEWCSGTKATIKKFLDKFAWDKSIAVAHNALFDMAILNWHFDIRPKRIVDTLAMARALLGSSVSVSLASLAKHYGLGVKGTEVVNALGKYRADFTKEELARYGEYCCNDGDLTYDLFNTMMQEGFPVAELRLIDLTTRMFSEPVLELDTGVLDGHLAAVQDFKQDLLCNLLYKKEDLMSNPMLAQILRAHGVEPPMKISPTTGKETYAFAKSDEAFKDLLEHENLVIQAVVAARLGVKSTLEETRTERFIRIAIRGSLPVPLRYYAAHTGRWGGTDKVNMQNIPRVSPLKRAFTAPEGFVLIDSDSSQIEARTLAWLAGQQDLVDAFERGEDVYKLMASAIYNKDIHDITTEERFVGKTTILGCLAEGTPVLCERGWVPIEEVGISDRVWDGEEWVCHQGLVPKGIKETLPILGLWLTPDHKVLCGTQWLEAQSVAQDENILSRALDTGAACLPSQATSLARGVAFPLSSSVVTAEDLSIPWTYTTLNLSRPLDVQSAGVPKGVIHAKNTGGTLISSPISHTANGCLTASQAVSGVATTQRPRLTHIMEHGVFASTNLGAQTEGPSSAISSPSMDGTYLHLIWTVSTTTGGTSQTTSGLSAEQRITGTEEKSTSCRRNLMTYDLAYAGPRNRYTVATDRGPIIVHNCGYGMGAAKFKTQLKTMGVDMPQEECERIIYVYRETYPHIPLLWKQAQTAVKAMVGGSTSPLGVPPVLTIVGNNGIRLPNGLHLKYPNIRCEEVENKLQYFYDVKKGKSLVKNKIYGGKLVENVCQALARIMVGEQMLLISKKYKVAMTVHDSVIAVVPKHEAETGKEFVEMAMRMRPRWGLDLPLNCEAGVGPNYGECK